MFGWVETRSVRVVAGTHKSAFIAGGAAVLFVAAALTVGAVRDAATTRANRQAEAAARQLNATTIASVHHSVVVPSTFQASSGYGDGGCSEYALGCWTTSDAPMVAATKLEAAVKRAGFVVVGAYCASTARFCEVTARVGQARVSYWVASAQTWADTSTPGEAVTDITGFIAA
jgi:hypothetical protein